MDFFFKKEVLHCLCFWIGFNGISQVTFVHLYMPGKVGRSGKWKGSSMLTPLHPPLLPD